MTSRGRVFAAAGIVVVLAASVGAAVAVVRPFAQPTPTVALAAPRFADETTTSGLVHTYGGGDLYATGGGVAVLDCDDDGRPDVYLAGGGNASALYRNVAGVGGKLMFERRASRVIDVPGVTGAYPLDVDGDGHVDLAVLRVGRSELLRGRGDCTFDRSDWPAGDRNTWTTAFSARWDGAARLPTLAFGRYLRLGPDGEPKASAYACGDNILVRPGPDPERYGRPEALAPGYCALSMLFSDWDRSGRRDLRVSNDRHYYDQQRGKEQLWRIDQGAAPRAYTDADGWVGVQVEGMGIGSYDLTGDGYPEVYLTSQADNRLQTLLSGASRPTYRDIGLRRGVNATTPFAGGDRLPSTAWHPEFQDVNNDGLVDLFVSKGNVDAQAGFATRDPSNLFLGQPDGTFIEAADRAGVLSFDRGRGASLADFNLDGLLDLVLVNYGAPVKVWRNVGTGTPQQPSPLGDWLAVRVSQDAPNRDAIGAWLELRVGDAIERRELTVGGGHSGGQLGWVHFGLGRATSADVRVTWPDGTVGPWLHADGDQFVTLRRRDAAVQHWEPTRPGGG